MQQKCCASQHTIALTRSWGISRSGAVAWSDSVYCAESPGCVFRTKWSQTMQHRQLLPPNWIHYMFYFDFIFSHRFSWLPHSTAFPQGPQPTVKEAFVKVSNHQENHHFVEESLVSWETYLGWLLSWPLSPQPKDQPWLVLSTVVSV